MKKNHIPTKFILFTFLLTILSCASEYNYKSESIVGYWQVREELSPLKNGIQQNIYVSKYYVRLLEDNCGYLYDENEALTNNIKWAVQERSDKDQLLISVALNSSGFGSNLSINTLSTIEKYKEMSFRTYRSELDTVGEDKFSRLYTTYYVRQ